MRPDASLLAVRHIMNQWKNIDRHCRDEGINSLYYIVKITLLFNVQIIRGGISLFLAAWRENSTAPLCGFFLFVLAYSPLAASIDFLKTGDAFIQFKGPYHYFTQNWVKTIKYEVTVNYNCFWVFQVFISSEKFSGNALSALIVIVVKLKTFF